MRFIVEHPYIFGCTLIACSLYAIGYVLWGAALKRDFTARCEDD